MEELENNAGSISILRSRLRMLSSIQSAVGGALATESYVVGLSVDVFYTSHHWPVIASRDIAFRFWRTPLC